MAYKTIGGHARELILGLGAASNAFRQSVSTTINLINMVVDVHAQKPQNAVRIFRTIQYDMISLASTDQVDSN
jgi:hypothetical protein